MFPVQCFQTVGFSRIKPVIIELANDTEFGEKFETTECFWEQIDGIISTLKPLYIVSKEMQQVGYGLTDFFISWLRIEKNLNRFDANSAQFNLGMELLRELGARRADLFDTPCMLAAIYLDPRVKFKLNNTQKECAILHLKNLYIRMKHLELKQIDTTDQHNNTLDEMNEEYAATHREEEQFDSSHLLLSLSNYDAVTHVDFKCAVMDFWQMHQPEYPLIYPLACVIHAIPAGQSFEERNFSSFSFIRSARRTRLSAENTKNVLLIRLNKELFYEYKQKQIDEIIIGKKE